MSAGIDTWALKRCWSAVSQRSCCPLVAPVPVLPLTSRSLHRVARKSALTPNMGGGRRACCATNPTSQRFSVCYLHIEFHMQRDSLYMLIASIKNPVAWQPRHQRPLAHKANREKSSSLRRRRAIKQVAAAGNLISQWIATQSEHEEKMYSNIVLYEVARRSSCPSNSRVT